MVWVQHHGFFKIVKDSHYGFEANSNQNNHLFVRHVADESDYKLSTNSQGYIDFSMEKSRLCNKSAENCSGALAKDRVSRSGNRLGETEKLKLKSQKLISNPRMTLGKVTSLLDFLFSTVQGVLPATLQIRFLQQQQKGAIKNNFSYQSAMYLNQDSIQELQWCSTTWRFAMAD